MSAIELAERVQELVDDALAHGGLVGHGYGRTLTLDGRRRLTIRVQVDIFDAVYGRQMGWSYYPDLAGLIDDAVARWRREHAS